VSNQVSKQRKGQDSSANLANAQLWNIVVRDAGTGRQVAAKVVRVDPETEDGSQRAWIGKRELMAQRKAVELSNVALRASLLANHVNSDELESA
jgi:hypothetical protein